MKQDYPKPKTHAEKFYFESMRKYSGIYSCGHAISNHVFLGNGTGLKWQNGRIVDYVGPIGKNPYEMTEECAYYRIIGQRYFTFSGYVSWAPLFNIPKDITPDWLDKVRGFCYHVMHTKVAHYKVMVKGYYLMLYGDGFYKHPDGMIKAMYERAIADFIEVRKHVKEVCKQQGWEYFYKRVTKKERARREALAEELIKEVMAKK